MSGSIERRGQDSWSVRFDAGRDPVTGKRRQVRRTVKGSKRDAQTLLTQLEHQRDMGIDQPPGKLTTGEYLKQWVEGYVKSNTAPATHIQYESLIRRHLIPILGSVVLTKLRPMHIQNCYARALE